jgi:hypothetical protein
VFKGRKKNSKKKAANRKGSNLFSSEIQRDARAHQVTGRYREEKKGPVTPT